MKTLVTIALGFLGFFALLFVITGANLASLKFWGPQFEEARREISQQSQRRVEGVSQGIAALCLNMRTSSDANTRKAYADMILVQAAAQPKLETPAMRCIDEANQELNK